jgi:hypothetical protein
MKVNPIMTMRAMTTINAITEIEFVGSIVSIVVSLADISIFIVLFVVSVRK